ncbi:MAG: flagellar hook-length control protein FliK [Planctomycetota bacterium]|jgi:flagellar hook-length control protein FliK
MNAELLAVDNTFLGATSPRSASSTTSRPDSWFSDRFEEVASDEPGRPSSVTCDTPVSVNAAEDRRTDNKCTSAKENQVETQPRETDREFRSEAPPEMPRKPDGSAMPIHSQQRPAEQPDLTQFSLGRASLVVNHSSAGTGEEVEFGVGHQLVRLITGSKANGLPVAPLKTAKSPENAVLVPSPANQNRPKALAAPDSSEPLNAKILSEGRQNTETTTMLDATNPIIKNLIRQQGGEDSVLQTRIGVQGKETLGSASNAAGSREAHLLAANESASQEVVNTAGKTPAISLEEFVRGRTAVAGSESAPQFAGHLMSAQGKTLGPDTTLIRSTSREKEAIGAEVPEGRVLSESVSGDIGQQPNGLPANALFGQAGSPESETSAGQQKGNGSLKSKNSSLPDFVRLVSEGSAQSSIKETTTATWAQVGRTSGDTVPKSGMTDVGRQVLESIQNSLRNGDQQITIRLNPPELGRVLIRFQEQQDQITGLLEVSKTQTRHQIEQALPQIIRSLQDAGVQSSFCAVSTSRATLLDIATFRQMMVPVVISAIVCPAMIMDIKAFPNPNMPLPTIPSISSHEQRRRSRIFFRLQLGLTGFVFWAAGGGFIFVILCRIGV